MNQPARNSHTARSEADRETSLSSILDAARLGTWEADVDADTLRLSPFAARLFDLEESEDVSLDEWLSHVHPADRAQIEERLRGHAGSGSDFASGFTLEFRWAPPQGVTRWVEARGRVIDGAAAGVVSEITERKAAEEQSRERNGLMAEVLESLPIGVWLLDREGRIVHGNPAAENIWAGVRYVAPDDSGPYADRNPSSGQRLEPHEWAASRAVQRGETSPGELIDIENFRGERKTIVNSALPLRDRHGEITGVLVMNEDVTEKRRIEEALRDSEVRFSGIFNQSEVSISFIGLDGRFLLANPTTCRLLGYEEDEMIGLPMAAVIHPDDLPITSEAFDRMIRGEQASYHVERRYLRKDGHIVWGRATTSVVTGSAGEPRYLVTVAEDVSERRHAEEAEKRHAEQMRLLAGIAADLLESADAGGMIEQTYARVAGHVGADVYLYHSVVGESGALRLQFSKGLSDAEQAQLAVLSSESADICDSLRHRLADFGVHGCRAYPLLCQGEIAGALTFGVREQDSFPADTADFLRTISHYVGLAMERALLTERLNARIGQYGLLIAAQREIAQAEPDLSTRMQMLSARIQEIAQSSGAGITRIEDEEAEYIAGCGTLESVVGLRISVYDSLVGRAVLENRPMRSDDTLADPRVHQEACRRHNIRSMVAVPIQYNSTTVGALTVVSDRPRAFNDDHVAVAEVMSSIVVAAMSAVAEAETREALSTAEERLRLALEGARIGIWSWDIPSDTVYCSPEAFLLLGHRPGVAMSAKRSLEHVHPDERDSAMSAMRHILAEQDSYDMERRFVHGDGSVHWVTARGRVIRAADGAAIRLEGVLIDSTEQKRLQEQLLQAQKMEGIGRLAGGIAHDFNNLLSVILGYAELIQMDLTEQSPLSSSLRNIQSAATRAASLTKQLLAFARRQAADPRVVDLNDLIQGMGEMLKPLLGEQIDLRVSTEAAPALIRIDPTQMEQVIVNLAVNARDAMPSGGSLLISTENAVLEGGRMQEDVGVVPGEYVRLSVSDTGHGIDPAVMERLFEPFFTTKERGKGTGLGLATCYGILRQNGGYIWPYSEPGVGTTFKLFLPAAGDGPPPAHSPAPPVEAARGSATVLVVEDEDLVRDLVVGALRNSGYMVLAARDGREGLDVAARFSGPIHLLLSDLVMPNMGGEELAQELRRQRPDIRVAFVSGYSEDMATLKGLLPPDTPLFEKPIAPSSLLARIAEMLGSAKEA